MKKGVLIFLLCAVVAGVFYVQHHSSILPSPGKEPTPMTEPVTITELEHKYGEPIWFVSCDIPVLSVQITFQNVIPLLHTKNTPGILQLLAALLNEGAGPYTSQELKRKCVDKKISFHVSSDGDSFGVFFRTLSENAADAFELAQLMLTQPRFADEDVVRVKQQIVAQLKQSLHQPQVVAIESFKQAAFPKDHPYATTIKQKIDSITDITTEQLRQTLQVIATQTRALVVAAGKAENDKIISMVEGMLKTLPKGESIESITVSPLQNLQEIQHVDMPLPQTNIIFSFPALSRKDPDFYAFYFAQKVLAGGPQSRLWEAVREKRGLAYGISANLFPGKLLEPFSLGFTATKTESVQEVIQIIRDEVKQFVDAGITEEELAFYKKLITGSYPLSFSSTNDLVQVLTSYRLDSLPVDYVKKRNGYFAALTLRQVNSAIQRIFSPDKIMFMTLGKK
jgi:zinc protease